MNFILTWSNGIGRVLVNDKYLVDILEKPVLPFEFDAVFFETPTHVRFKVLNGVSSPLTDTEADQAVQWIQRFSAENSFPIQAVKPESMVYVGTMLKKEADEKGLLAVVAEAPDFPVAKWVGDHWERVAAAIGRLGYYVIHPSQDHERLTLYFTEKEWSEFPHPDIADSRWDFEKQRWYDARELDKTKERAIVTLHQAFVNERLAVSEDVPSIEMQTWERQALEAAAYLREKDLPPAEQTPTPFLDAMLEAMRGTGATKYTLATRIRAHSDSDYWGEVGAVHGRMYHLIWNVRNAETLDELDRIMHEASLNHTFTWDKKFGA